MPTIGELYNTICSVVQAKTGYPTWTKTGIQATPKGPYATVFLERSEGRSQDVVEVVELAEPGANGETLTERPWGASHIMCLVEFRRDTTGQTALNAATKFRNALQLSERFDDLWAICGLAGVPTTIDFSAVFRADTESRVRVTFAVNANINEPLPDSNIHEIHTSNIEVYREDTDHLIATISEDNV